MAEPRPASPEVTFLKMVFNDHVFTENPDSSFTVNEEVKKKKEVTVPPAVDLRPPSSVSESTADIYQMTSEEFAFIQRVCATHKAENTSLQEQLKEAKEGLVKMEKMAEDLEKSNTRVTELEGRFEELKTKVSWDYSEMLYREDLNNSKKANGVLEEKNKTLNQKVQEAQRLLLLPLEEAVKKMASDFPHLLLPLSSQLKKILKEDHDDESTMSNAHTVSNCATPDSLMLKTPWSREDYGTDDEAVVALFAIIEMNASAPQPAQPQVPGDKEMESRTEQMIPSSLAHNSQAASAQASSMQNSTHSSAIEVGCNGDHLTTSPFNLAPIPTTFATPPVVQVHAAAAQPPIAHTPVPPLPFDFQNIVNALTLLQNHSQPMQAALQQHGIPHRHPIHKQQFRQPAFHYTPIPQIQSFPPHNMIPRTSMSHGFSSHHATFMPLAQTPHIPPMTANLPKEEKKQRARRGRPRKTDGDEKSKKTSNSPY